MVEYLVDVLAGAYPGELPREATAVQFLKRGVEQFEEAPPEDPMVATRVILTLASGPLRTWVGRGS